MQMIKFYAWEQPFRKEVMAARANEAQLLKDSTWWMALFGMLLFSGPVMVAVFCFGAYALAGQPLSTAGAYTALALCECCSCCMYGTTTQLVIPNPAGGG